MCCSLLPTMLPYTLMQFSVTQIKSLAPSVSMLICFVSSWIIFAVYLPWLGTACRQLQMRTLVLWCCDGAPGWGEMCCGGRIMRRQNSSWIPGRASEVRRKCLLLQASMVCSSYHIFPLPMPNTLCWPVTYVPSSYSSCGVFYTTWGERGKGCFLSLLNEGTDIVLALACRLQNGPQRLGFAPWIEAPVQHHT